MIVTTQAANKRELWQRIKNYKFNNLVPHSTWADIIEKMGARNASVRAFANKIIKKHRLPRAFVFRAIEEYKKFIYLGVISDFYVTPSKYIDLVWHEHILFSKGYREFCNNVINYQFDHQPELVATEDQTELFTAQFLETLELYKKEFGMEPPENIWGMPKFDQENLNTANKSVSKKKNNSDSSGGYYVSEGPLFIHFDHADLTHEFSGFDSGDFGGAGAGGDFGDSDDGGDSGGDGGGCSGGCGGGGD